MRGGRAIEQQGWTAPGSTALPSCTRQATSAALHAVRKAPQQGPCGTCTPHTNQPATLQRRASPAPPPAPLPWCCAASAAPAAPGRAQRWPRGSAGCNPPQPAAAAAATAALRRSSVYNGLGHARRPEHGCSRQPPPRRATRSLNSSQDRRHCAHPDCSAVPPLGPARRPGPHLHQLLRGLGVPRVDKAPPLLVPQHQSICVCRGRVQGGLGARGQIGRPDVQAAASSSCTALRRAAAGRARERLLRQL